MKRKQKVPQEVERFQPAFETGLTLEQVQARKASGLANDIRQQTGKSYLAIILGNIFTYLNILCYIVAAALIAVRAIDDLFFLVIISANTVIGIAQEIKAKHMIGKLKIMSQSDARAVRGGETVSVPVSEVVLDDVLILTTGNQVPSDCIVMEGNVEVNESMLTGESDAVRKAPGDLLYGGSYVTLGTCYAKVEHVREDNFIQKLTSKAKQYKRPQSEILRTLSAIIKIIGILIIPISILMYFHNAAILPANEAIPATSGAMIGMIPSGLFLLTSARLVVGIIKLARKQCLVQDMYCIEMLARVNVLCLDKTGTITDGKMIVQGYVPVEMEEEEGRKVVSSMQAALQDNNFTSIALGNYFGTEAVYPSEEILPFMSQNKYSAVRLAGTLYLLGAPEFVCKERSAELDSLIEQFSSKGLRVLMLARGDGAIEDKRVTGTVRPMGLITLSDNIRERTVETIEWFRKNDVSIRVISGDNPRTVSEVARRAGIEDADRWISLEGMSPEEVVAVANEYRIFGRVTPEQKAVLVRAMRQAGNTVAMTGDGVNDILALKEADCSIAMAAGSDAAKNVSNLVLMDSKFTSMPQVVEEGRKVINNIQRSSSLFLMKTIFTMLLSLIVICTPGMAYPFSPKNLMIMEICVIGLPSFVLALEPNQERVKGHFLSQTFSKALPNGLILLMSVLALVLYANYVPTDEEKLGALCVLSLTFVSFLLLVDLCIPMTWIRMGMIVGMAALGVVISIIKPGFIGLEGMVFTVQEGLVVTVVVLASYPLTHIFNYLARELFQAADRYWERRKKSRSHTA